MEQRCWKTEIQLSEDITVRQLHTIVTNLDRLPCLRVSYSAKTGLLVVYLEEPNSLRGAPDGTHDFARGWLMHRDARAVNKYCGFITTTWEAVKVYDNGRVIRDDKSRDFKLQL